MTLDRNSNSPHKQIELPDGRLLGFTQYGDLEGQPIFFFHGWPGARLQGGLADKPARRLGIRIIAPDRPGFGLSNFQPNRQILDWPDDVVFLAEHLHLDEFGVIGLSGGAPYALACAFEIPKRLISVGIISGVGPSDLPGAVDAVSEELRRMVRLAGIVPWILTLILKRVARRRQHNPEGEFSKLLDSLPETDRIALSHPDISLKAMEASADSFRPGVKGHAWEMRLFGRSWGFGMEDVQIPVLLWHGTVDENILPLTGKMQAEAIPNCTAKFLETEGHYSLYINHIDEILQDLIR
jgi:pimeloyl-ACP methyl ester carboxylesterase